MSVNSETKKLIASIHDQVNIGHIDWERVAKDLGTPTANAARVRWQRFRKTLPNLNNEQNEDGTITPPPMTPRKLQSPKKSKTLKGSPTKKQKRSRPGKDSDDDDDELRFDMKEKEEKKDILPETPARCLPSRKAKAKSPIKKVSILLILYILSLFFFSIGNY